MCQTIMLVRESSRELGASRARRIANGTCSASSTAQSTGRPSHIDIARKVSGGKPVTPSFITGQFRPQASVRSVSRARSRGAEAVVEAQFRPR